MWRKFSLACLGATILFVIVWSFLPRIESVPLPKVPMPPRYLSERKQGPPPPPPREPTWEEFVEKVNGKANSNVPAGR